MLLEKILISNLSYRIVKNTYGDGSVDFKIHSIDTEYMDSPYAIWNEHIWRCGTFEEAKSYLTKMKEDKKACIQEREVIFEDHD